ncbi:MAG TPA: GldG family protein [Terriglobales bacterium]|nr:GldG family protein [Terriglobales bacterium]
MADDKINSAAENHVPPRSGLRRWADRGPLLLYSVVVLAILVFVNYIARDHSRSWDLTLNQIHSLSPESVKVVRGLKTPLHLIYFDRAEAFGRAREFLGKYQRQSNQVDVQYIEPDRHPDKARQYGIQSYGTLVVESGGRKQLVNSLTEEDLTNALVRVLKGGRKVVYFVEGEGEHDPEDSGRSGYSQVKQALQDDNFTVKTLVLAQSPQIPADAAVVVVGGPTREFVQPEVTAISDYLSKGGRALFLLGPETKGPLLDYVESSLDVKLTPDIVVDTSGVGRLFGASELMPIVAKYDEHPITKEMSRLATLFPYARTVEPGDVKNSKASVTPLLETSSASFASSNFSLRQVSLDPRTARRGPLTLAMAGTLPGAKPADEGRFAVFGSADFIANGIVGFNGNRDLFLNAINWLASQESFISIRPKPPNNTPINLSQNQMRVIFWSCLVGLPLLIVLGGIGVWWDRRRA